LLGLTTTSALLVTVLASFPVVAQTQSGAATVPGSSVSRTGGITVVFTVTGRHGEFVNDLKKEQIRILDDGKPPKELFGFQAQTSTPVRLGLILDTSNSERDTLSDVKLAADRFVRDVIRPDSDQGFVMAFDEVADLVQDFTSDAEKLSRGINNVVAGGGTAAWDAIYVACRDRMANASHGLERLVIVFVTDGKDTMSKVTPDEALRMAQKSGVIVYYIDTDFNRDNLSYSPASQVQKLKPKTLADSTGGRAFFPNSKRELAKSFTLIQIELNNQYSIGYQPDGLSPDGKFRTIRIQLDPPNKHLKVRAREGYFARN